MDYRSARLWFLLAVPLLLGSLAPAASAGPRDHDGGFFLRLSGGIGGAATELQDVSPTWKLSGACSDLNLAIGGMVARNLALHATIFGWGASDPELKIGGASVTMNGDLTLSAIGAGLTYYVMPIDLYLSGSIGAGSLRVDLPSGSGETDTGAVFDFTLGKEWWVSRSWGLGIAGGLGLHAIPEKGISKDWTGASVALRFTATYN